MHPAARSSILRPFRFLMLMWLFFSVSFFFNIDFGFLGILPRSYFGIIGIFTSPLVHGNLNHISSNSVPVLFLGTILYFFYPKIANRIFLQCYFFTNILVWFFGRTFLHIGASGLIYALAFFLISIGFSKNVCVCPPMIKSIFLVFLANIKSHIKFSSFEYEKPKCERHIIKSQF